MPVTVLIPSALRVYAGKQDSVSVAGTTVGEVLSTLTTHHSALKKQLFAEDNTLRKFVNVYVNDEDIRYLQHEHTPVTDNDVISIIPSIAGG